MDVNVGIVSAVHLCQLDFRPSLLFRIIFLRSLVKEEMKEEMDKLFLQNHPQCMKLCSVLSIWERSRVTTVRCII